MASDIGSEEQVDFQLLQNRPNWIGIRFTCLPKDEKISLDRISDEQIEIDAVR